MSKKEKLFLKLKSLPNDFNFSELETLLKNFWFEKIKTNAWSHFKWIHRDKNVNFFAPRKNPMKKIYLKELLNILEIYF